MGPGLGVGCRRSTEQAMAEAEQGKGDKKDASPVAPLKPSDTCLLSSSKRPSTCCPQQGRGCQGTGSQRSSPGGYGAWGEGEPGAPGPRSRLSTWGTEWSASAQRCSQRGLKCCRDGDEQHEQRRGGGGGSLGSSRCSPDSRQLSQHEAGGNALRQRGKGAQKGRGCT